MPFPELFFAFKTGLKSIIKMPMDRFTKASMKITRKMASFFFGVLMETSIKAVIRKTNAMVFTLYN